MFPVFDTTYPDLKEEDAQKENPFGVVEGVDSAVDELKGTAGEQVGTCIPPNIVDRVEVVRDLGDGGSEDGAIL